MTKAPPGRIRSLLSSDLVRRLSGAGLVAFIIKILGAGLGYLMLVAFARMMDATAYGQFGQMLNMAIVLSSVIALGLPTGALRFWPGHMAKGEHALAKGFARGAQRLLLVAGATAMLLAGLATFAGVGASGFGASYALLAVAALAVLMALGDYYSGLLRSLGLVAWSMAPRDVLWRIAAPAIAAVLLWQAGTLTALQAIICCLAILALIALAQALVAARAVNTAAGDVPAQSQWRAWARPLLPLAGASILYAMVQQLDVVVVGYLAGPEQAGAYFAAQKTASLLGLVMIAGGMVAAPMMAAAHQAGRRDELQRLCRLLAAAIAAATFAGLLVLAAMGQLLLGIFDAAYVQAYGLLLVLGIGFTVDALAGPTAYLMQMTSLEGAYLRIMAIVYAFVLSLQFLLVPTYGVMAAACASTAGICLWNLIAVRLLRREIGVDPSLLGFVLPVRN